MLNQGSLAIRLWKFRHCIDTIKHDLDLQTAFARYGIDADKLQDFADLYGDCAAAYHRSRNLRGENLTETDSYQEELNAARLAHGRHVLIARYLFPNRGDQLQLGIAGSRPTVLAEWIYKARGFYENLGPGHVAAMAGLKVTEEELMTVAQQMDDLEYLVTRVHNRRIRRQTNTLERDQRFVALAEAGRLLELVTALLAPEIPNLENTLLREPQTGSRSANSGQTEANPEPELLSPDNPAAPADGAQAQAQAEALNSLKAAVAGLVQDAAAAGRGEPPNSRSLEARIA